MGRSGSSSTASSMSLTNALLMIRRCHGECFWFLFVGPALSALPEPAACLYGMSEAIWKCWAAKLAALQECDWRELFHRERVHLYWVRYDVPSMRDSGACDA